MHDYGVFVPDVATRDEARVDALAQVTGLSRIDAKMVLASRIPRRTGAAESESEAERQVKALRKGGFDAFWVRFDDLKRFRARPIKSATLIPEGVVFEPEGRFALGELRLIIHGTVHSRTTHTTETRMSVGLVAGVPGMTGGSLTTGRSKTRRADSQEFVHLYGLRAEDVYEFRPRAFNFRPALGEEFGYSAAVNVRTLIGKLQSLFPDARYDATLLDHPFPFNDLTVGGAYSMVPGVGSSQSQTTRGGTEQSAIRASMLMARSVLGESLGW